MMPLRSRFHVCDVGSAVRSAFDISGIIHQAFNAIQSVELEHVRPSVLYRPSISIDGNQWIALYGDNLQDGVAGSGDSPEEAMRNFDKAWFEKLGSV
jgi:hypothetical protein